MQSLRDFICLGKVGKYVWGSNPGRLWDSDSSTAAHTMAMYMLEHIV